MNRRDMLKLFACVPALAVVKDVEVLSAKPTDVIVLKVSHPMSEAGFKALEEAWKKSVPQFQHVVILSSDIDVAVIRKETK